MEIKHERLSGEFPSRWSVTLNTPHDYPSPLKYATNDNNAQMDRATLQTLCDYQKRVSYKP